MKTLTQAQKTLLNEVVEKDMLIRHHEEATSYVRSAHQVTANQARIKQAHEELKTAIAACREAGIPEQRIRMAVS